jgi:hypothetical protein
MSDFAFIRPRKSTRPRSEALSVGLLCSFRARRLRDQTLLVLPGANVRKSSSDPSEAPTRKGDSQRKKSRQRGAVGSVTQRRRNHSMARPPERLGRGGALRVSRRGQHRWAEHDAFYAPANWMHAPARSSPGSRNWLRSGAIVFSKAARTTKPKLQRPTLWIISSRRPGRARLWVLLRRRAGSHRRTEASFEMIVVDRFAEIAEDPILQSPIPDDLIRVGRHQNCRDLVP